METPSGGQRPHRSPFPCSKCHIGEICVSPHRKALYTSASFLSAGPSVNRFDMTTKSVQLEYERMFDSKVDVSTVTADLLKFLASV